MPDAPLPSVHDQLGPDTCDRAWGPDAAYCENACNVPPTEKPCRGAVPCDDQGACTAANGRLVVACEATFSVDDWQGTHRGCCQVREAIGFHIPTFYECVPPR